MKSSNAEDSCVDTDDTVEFDPWEKVLTLLTAQQEDIKYIKHQIKTLNANIDLVRQSQHTEARRITILETKSAQRDSTYPLGLTPLPMNVVGSETD